MNWINTKNNTPASSDLYLCLMKNKAVGGYCVDTLYWNEFQCRWENYCESAEAIENQSTVLYHMSLRDIPLPAELTGCSC